MNESSSSDFLAGGFGVVVGLFMLVLAILWMLLPFMVYGISSRIDKLQASLNEQVTLSRALLNTALNAINSGLPAPQATADPPQPTPKPSAFEAVLQPSEPPGSSPGQASDVDPNDPIQQRLARERELRSRWRNR